MHIRVKAHYGDPFWDILKFNIIIHIIELFQKYGTFNFGYQFWFLGFKFVIFIKLML
jgi:hypothetical protein